MDNPLQYFTYRRSSYQTYIDNTGSNPSNYNVRIYSFCLSKLESGERFFRFGCCVGGWSTSKTCLRPKERGFWSVSLSGSSRASSCTGFFHRIDRIGTHRPIGPDFCRHEQHTPRTRLQSLLGGKPIPSDGCESEQYIDRSRATECLQTVLT